MVPQFPLLQNVTQLLRKLIDIIKYQCKSQGHKCLPENCGCNKERISCTPYCNCSASDVCCNPFTRREGAADVEMQDIEKSVKEAFGEEEGVEDGDAEDDDADDADVDDESVEEDNLNPADVENGVAESDFLDYYVD